MDQVSSNICPHIGILFMSERLLSILAERDESNGFSFYISHSLAALSSLAISVL